ncbi:MAG TPA: hypothetical protein VFI53_02705 [Myxococcaceae bacterium]|nr:hypothetical protein [Myxococcaceae bacterium]
MQSLNPTLVSWRVLARELLTKLLFRPRYEPPRLMPWAEMHPIDFEGEDESLRERDLGLMK